MDYPFKNKPFLHQRAYLERFWNKPVAALFADMGTGGGTRMSGARSCDEGVKHWFSMSCACSQLQLHQNRSSQEIEQAGQSFCVL
jgi:hypothetical protein